MHDVARLEAGFVCRAARSYLRNQRAISGLEAEGFSQVVVYFLNHHADAAALNFAVAAQLVGHIHGYIDGDGEGDAHKAAGLAVDLGIYAHHLPAQVEQWAAGVAGVDGHVGLDERGIVFIGQAAAFGGNDAGGYAVVEAERCADGGYPFAYAQGFGIADFDGGQALRVDF